MLGIGHALPDLVLPDDAGQSIRLNEYTGQKLIVYFYPRDNTPGCTNEAVSFENAREDLDKLGYRIIGISTDSPASHVEFKQKYDLGFQLLSDENRLAAEAFGVWVLKKQYGKSYHGIQRSTFIFDETGHVVKVYPKVKPAGHGQEIVEDIRTGKI